SISRLQQKTYITDRHRLRIHPLPPPIIGHLTGLTCPECPLNSTSQLRYHPPRFPNPANINWKKWKSYIRTLQLEHLINNIRAVNTGAQPPPPPGSLSSLLNRSNKAPDHIKIKSTGNLCPGYLGQTGATHHSSIKSNMKCSHKLCISCCQMGQRMHHLTCKFKAHPVELLANSRQAAKSVAVRTILIELWTKHDDPRRSTHWPRSSLQESQIVLDQFRKASSDTGDWESEIHVWNMDQFRWISLAPTCTLTYPLIPRKLLVRLERVSDDDCTGLQDAILKMTAEGPYEPLTTPARCILANLPSSGLTHTHTVQDKHKTLKAFRYPLLQKLTPKTLTSNG
ncbi:hypothetical protein KEM48_006662, partial [Puccinia striiformis f. sp. tritici PST-130]